MLYFTSRFGRRASRRLRLDKIIWFTTTDSHNSPQPRPVWFHWDGRTVLIFSERRAAKVRHIGRNPRVALNLNSDPGGDNVVVLVGAARILRKAPQAARVKSYLRKYRQGIKDIEMTIPQFAAAFTVPIIVVPKAMRGL